MEKVCHDLFYLFILFLILSITSAQVHVSKFETWNSIGKEKPKNCWIAIQKWILNDVTVVNFSATARWKVAQIDLLEIQDLVPQ